MFELTVSDVAQGGWCVARDDSGKVVFVRHALPGERVRARITADGASFARADAIEILTPSPDRVTPPCPHARPGGCGGCDWQHASLPAQRRFKAEIIRRELLRTAGIEREVSVEPVAGDTEGLGWRTRVRFSVGSGGTAGLLAHRSHEIVDVGDCPIAHPLVRSAGVPERRWDGLSSVEVTVSPATGERAVILTPAPGGRHRTGSPPGVDAAEQTTLGPANGRRRPEARQRFRPDRHAGAMGVRGRPPGEQSGGSLPRVDTVLVARPGGGLAPLSGSGQLRQVAGEHTWRVGAGTFWQVHPGAPAALAEAVLAALAPQAGDTVLDLYCGAGLFAVPLAEAVGPGGAVIGVDSDRAAIRDARHNLRRLPWAQVRAGDVAAVLGRPGWPAPGLAVLDPPRTGAARPVIEHLVAGAPRRVVYVSCDPATLARDIAVFARSGWQLTALRAFDAFPMTHHVECVATLTPPA